MLIRWLYPAALLLVRPIWWWQSLRRWLSRRAARASSTDKERRVLLLAHNELMARYAATVEQALRNDDRVSFYLARPPLVEGKIRSSEIRNRITASSVSFWRSLWVSWDLIVATDHYPVAAYHPRTPKVFVSHGFNSGKKLGTSDYVHGKRALRWNGSSIYTAMFAAGRLEHDYAISINPALGRCISIVGDPFVDRLLERNRQRQSIRRHFGAAGRRVALIMSSWGPESLIRTQGTSFLRIASGLRDEYHFVFSFHPNNLTRSSGEFDGNAFLADVERAGASVIGRGEDWVDYLVAADVAISDFTSLCLYFLQLKRPILMVPFDCERMFDEGAPIRRLYQLVPKLAAPVDFEATIADALARPVGRELERLADELVDCRGRAIEARAACLREILDLVPRGSPKDGRAPV